MSSTDHPIIVRVRTTLYFWHQRTEAAGGAMTQFWESVLVDKQAAAGLAPDLDDAGLQAALLDYVMHHERNTNQLLYNGEWDGSLYKILEVAAAPLHPDDADAKGLKVSQGEWRPAVEGTNATALAATERLQALESVAGWRSAYHGRFDFGAKSSITADLHEPRLLPVDQSQVFAITMGSVVGNAY